MYTPDGRLGVEALVPSAGSLTTGTHGTQASPCAFVVPANQNQTWFKIPQRHGRASACSWRSMSAGAHPLTPALIERHTRSDGTQPSQS